MSHGYFRRNTVVICITTVIFHRVCGPYYDNVPLAYYKWYMSDCLTRIAHGLLSRLCCVALSNRFRVRHAPRRRSSPVINDVNVLYTRYVSIYILHTYKRPNMYWFLSLNGQIYSDFSSSFWLDLLWKKSLFVINQLFSISSLDQSKIEMPVYFVLCVDRHFIGTQS